MGGLAGGWDHKVGEPWRKRGGEKCGRVKGREGEGEEERNPHS